MNHQGPLFDSLPERLSSSRPLSQARVIGLFAGIGGIELGLHQAGHSTAMVCEIEPTAQAVLRHHFPEVPLVADIREIDRLPPAEIIAGGFPCQDLSQAGKTAGITGSRSGLVAEVFRLLEDCSSDLRYLLLENVPFMLHLDGGQAMRFLTRSLEDMGLAWAYRTVDTRSFGLPQRRQRVILLASRTDDPCSVLFADQAAPPLETHHRGLACGFYWTEGIKGLGWAVNAVPTLKGGSTIGIPSPPAIWLPDGRIVTPEIRDAERMQGFPADWTLPALTVQGAKRGSRWKLVGNAVSVPLTRWIGERLSRPVPYRPDADVELPLEARWPSAAWGSAGRVFATGHSLWPLPRPDIQLESFLQYPPVPLSARATAGFLERTRRGTLHFPTGFLAAVEAHLERVSTPGGGGAQAVA